MKKGEILRVTIDKLAPDGSGLTTAENRKIEVKGALPGDVADVQVAALRRRRARVRLESIITEGVERIEAKCAHFGMCGGCRVTVGGETKFVCVDGPEFNGHEVDFENLINRLSAYKEQEKNHVCNLEKAT